MDEKGEVVVTLNEKGECVLVSRQNEEHEILSVIWEKPEAPTIEDLHKERKRRRRDVPHTPEQAHGDARSGVPYVPEHLHALAREWKALSQRVTTAQDGSAISGQCQAFDQCARQLERAIAAAPTDGREY